MGCKNPVWNGDEHMPMEEFDNEITGNWCRWRIVENDYSRNNGSPPLFVYRRVRLFGNVRSEYLNTRGKIDHSCGDGHFSDLAAVGAAFIMLAANDRDGRAYEDSYKTWLDAKRDERRAEAKTAGAESDAEAVNTFRRHAAAD